MPILNRMERLDRERHDEIKASEHSCKRAERGSGDGEVGEGLVGPFHLGWHSGSVNLMVNLMGILELGF